MSQAKNKCWLFRKLLLCGIGSCMEWSVNGMEYCWKCGLLQSSYMMTGL